MQPFLLYSLQVPLLNNMMQAIFYFGPTLILMHLLKPFQRDLQAYRFWITIRFFQATT